MTRLRLASLAVAAAATLSLAGCASVGDYIGIPGTGYPAGGAPGTGYPPPQSYGQTIFGDVQAVDHPNRRFVLVDQGSGYNAGSRVEVHYDQNTVAYYNGQQVALTGLEPGDRVQVQYVSSNGRVWARSVQVTQDVRSGGQYGGQPGGQYGGQYGQQATVEGAIGYVDARSMTIGYTRGGYTGTQERVRYDANTIVEYRGQRYQPANLERGDTVRMQLRQPAYAGGDWYASAITVMVSARER